MTTTTRNGWITYVGESRGHRTQLRKGIARRFGHPVSRIEFRECPDHQAETEIVAKNLRGRYDVVLTALDLRSDDVLAEAVWG